MKLPNLLGLDRLANMGSVCSYVGVDNDDSYPKYDDDEDDDEEDDEDDNDDGDDDDQDVVLNRPPLYTGRCSCAYSAEHSTCYY